MRTRTKAVVASLGAALSAGLLTGPATAGGSERVDVRDACDAADFVVDGEALCAPGFGGDVSIGELFAALTGDKGRRAMKEGRLLGWRNNPVVTHLDRGESLRAVSRGGEFHSFSQVDELSGGCVDEINAALRLPPTTDPRENNGATLLHEEHGNPLPPGGEVHIPADRLGEGTNYFQCLMHPWMHTTVHVH